MDSARVTIILPVRNDENNITRRISELIASFEGAELIVMDGCSTDATYGRVLDLMPAHPRLRLMTALYGQGAGIRTAVGWASEKTVLILLDPDMDLRQLRIIAHAKTAPGAPEIIAGFRYQRERPRAWLDAVVSHGIAWGMAGIGMRDAHPPVVAFNKAHWVGEVLQQTKAAVCFEYLVKAARRGARIKWHPVASDLGMPVTAALSTLKIAMGA